ncbi:MAG: hypothetical protein KC613_06795 [Myxococcales bacterium]|nr:hypothetical protein [Myxococcales bacterium]MCB9525469.1 hypothetical protein [Myxococcales bacterium]
MTRPRTPLLHLLVPLVAVLIPLSIVGWRYIPVARQYFDDQSCVGCHRQHNARLVDQWLDSAHFGADVGCEGCHGTDHDAMFAQDGDVSPKVCAECHAKAYQEFARSKHADSEVDARAHAMFQAAPPAMQRQGCLACHDIGKVWPDGTKGSCNLCHGGHRFSAAEAREPEACEACHMGPDHPQIEAWRSSKHGIAYRSGDTAGAPSCVTCHLTGESGHDVTANLTLGRGLGGAVLVGEDPGIPSTVIDRATFETNRARMLVICRQCHSEGFARRALQDGDEIKRTADALVAEAAQILRELQGEGLIEPAPADRPPNPVAGHAFVLGGQQGYSDTSAIEQRFFEMARFHHSITFKGAYHNSPDYTHWHGYAHLQADLSYIRGEAAKLRAIRANARAFAPTAAAAPTTAPASAAPASEAP